MLKKNVLIALAICFTTISVSARDSKENKDKVKISVADNVIPEEMDHNYDQLLIDWKNNLKYSQNCTTSDDSFVSVPDSVYIKRLYSLPTEMELAFNSVVRSYIEMYAGRRKEQVSYMLGEGIYYFPMFENILDKEGIPLELKYLPVIESALNPIARSRVGATGLWQFMAGTGKMYNLEINSLVDERRDPVKSSEAAAKYLKDLHNIYGDWNLVIAAYNCGPGNVNKAIRRSGGERDFWAIYPYLPRETRGYIPAFIAATYIMNYHEEHNICPAEPVRPASLDTLSVDKTVHFEQIAGVLDINIDDIRKFNPQFKNDIIPGEYKSYALNLPFSQVASFITNKDSIFAYRNNELLSHRKVVEIEGNGNKGASGGGTKNLVHRVKRGETLSLIAQKYGVSTSQLKNWNNLRSDRLTIGGRISIHKKTAAPAAVEIAQNTDDDSRIEEEDTDVKTLKKTITSNIRYKIKRNDTLKAIANKHGVTAAQIKKWNKLKTNSLKAGNYLNIEKKEIIEIAEEPVKLAKPELMVVTIDSEYISSIIGNYMSGIERDESTLPLVSIGGSNGTERSTRDDSKIIYHKVRIGETITQIASRYNVSKEEIVQWNELPSVSAKVGQRLLIYLPEKVMRVAQNSSTKKSQETASVKN